MWGVGIYCLQCGGDLVGLCVCVDLVLTLCLAYTVVAHVSL